MKEHLIFRGQNVKKEKAHSNDPKEHEEDLQTLSKKQTKRQKMDPLQNPRSIPSQQRQQQREAACDHDDGRFSSWKKSHQIGQSAFWKKRNMGGEQGDGNISRLPLPQQQEVFLSDESEIRCRFRCLTSSSRWNQRKGSEDVIEDSQMRRERKYFFSRAFGSFNVNDPKARENYLS